VGVVGPPIWPFTIAGFCGAAFSLMVGLEYFGIIPHQIPFWNEQDKGCSFSFVIPA